MNRDQTYINQTAVINQTSGRAQFHSCFKCRYQAVTSETVCPRCRKRLYSATNIRVRGVFMTLLGLFLSGLMGAIALFVTGLMMNAANNPRTTAKINADEHLILLMYAIFGGVFALGATSILAGLWQIVFGRRNMFLIWLFMTLIVVTIGIGGVFRILAP